METRAFAILLWKKSSVDASLQDLLKRAERKGLPATFTWTWGKVTTKKESMPHPEYGPSVDYEAPVTRIALEIAGEEPKLHGWTFTAALDHMWDDAGKPCNIVRSVEGKETPHEYRERGPVCDHCKVSRRRGSTFVLRHEDGRLMQVGSTCLGDFLGDDAFKVAARAEILASVRGIALDGCEGMSLGHANDWDLAEFLPWVCACIRVFGWRSRTRARDEGGQATADVALELITRTFRPGNGGVTPTVTEEDIEQAKKAVVWGEAISDAEVERESGDYLYNLRTIAKCNLVSRKSSGIAASMVSAWERAESKRIAAERVKDSVYFGTVAKREVFRLTLGGTSSYDTDYGTTHVYRFVDAAGNVGVWKASSKQEMEIGSTYDVKGTVKEHSVYKGVKQTVLNRCAVKVVSAPAVAGATA